MKKGLKVLLSKEQIEERVKGTGCSYFQGLSREKGPPDRGAKRGCHIFI